MSQLPLDRTPKYNYPYANVVKETQVRIKPGFNLQSAANRTKGTVLEIAGPSPDGYFFLQNITLPRRPIITNVNYKASVLKEFQALYTPYIEKKLDIIRHTLTPSSVGLCLVSCLNTIAHEPRLSDRKAWQKAEEQLALEDKALAANPKAAPKIGLRYIFLQRAITFLEDDGLVIAESLREVELKYALTLGFSLKATVTPYKQDNDIVYQSMVLQKAAKAK